MPIFIPLAFAFLLQNDSASPPDSGGVSHGANALMELMSNLSPVAMGVLAILLLASLYSWTVIFGKLGTFRKATSASRRFVRTFRKATRLQEIATISGDYKSSPLAQVFEDVYETYRRQTGGSGPVRSMAALERSAQTAASEAVTTLERRLTWLATIAATSPFVGLFGTVMGVVEAFHGLGTAGAATLRAVAPGMADALITTAAGLFVAVPAVVAYNQFAARVRIFAAAIDDFSRELLNSMEELQMRPPAQGPSSYAQGSGPVSPRPLSETGRELPTRG
jgi:biopolymer transport protein TolQ